MKPLVQNILGVVLILCALVITGSVVHREFAGAPASSAAVAVRYLKDWQRLTVDGQLVGPEVAPLRLVAFSDYQCIYCRVAEPLLDQLRERYAGRVAIVYRHFPIVEVHARAFAAANAAECAAAQNRFSEYHDALFANPDSVDLARWSSVARAVGVPDIASFERCVETEAFKDRVEHDARLAREIGVSGTPTFVFRDRMVSGTGGLSRVGVWLDSAFAGTSDTPRKALFPNARPR